MSFEFTTPVAVRYADIDSYGHVNNATYGTYFEEARIDYLDAVLPEDADLTSEGGRDGIVIANLQIDYERPIRLGDDVTVGVRVPRLGETSFPFEYEVRTADGVAATGETTVVSYDRQAGAPKPIPDDWRTAIVEFEGL